MESMKGQGGIQMLLTAEQQAQQIIASARNTKTTRLRQAKEEAEREAAAYRAYLEEEYQRTVSEYSGYSGSKVKQLETETETKIENLKKMSANAKSDVVSMLMREVITVKT